MIDRRQSAATDRRIERRPPTLRRRGDETRRYTDAENTGCAVGSVTADTEASAEIDVDERRDAIGETARSHRPGTEER